MIDVKSIPEALKEGENWPLLDIDPDWMWLSYDQEERIVGFLIAANCHGLVLIMRVKMLPSAPRTALLRLFRRFIRDIRRRGALGYFAPLNVSASPMEAGLARIAFRAGAKILPAQIYVAGSVEAGGHA